MTKGFTPALPKAQVPRTETALDKTARLAREILDEEARQRELKTAQLRQSRLDSENGKNVDWDAEAATYLEKKPPTNRDGQV